MTPGEGRYDVVVVGAGPAGTAAALQMRLAGFRVAILEREPFDEPEHDWYVGVPRRMLQESRLDLPEIRDARSVGTFVIQGPSGRGGIRPHRNPVCELHLGELVASLRRRLQKAGVDCFDRVAVDGFAFEGDRPVRLYAHRTNRARSVLSLSASLFVDATGLSAVLRRRVPQLAARCAVVGPDDLCSAFQEVREISDPQAADRFLRSRGVGPEEHLAWTGLAGGYSTLTIRVSPRKDRVWLLAGAALDAQGMPGREMLVRFRRDHSWVGGRISGGGGLIPIRRPYGTFVCEGLALIGNAACQVFPTHGSGVGAGLVAARYLTEALARRKDRDPGGIETLWAYQHRYQRSLGVVQAVHDAFRRFVQGLDRDAQDQLLDAGFPAPSALVASLDQELGGAGPDSLAALVRLTLRDPRETARLAELGVRSAALAFLYRIHPTNPSVDLQRRWAQSVEWLVERRIGI